MPRILLVLLIASLLAAAETHPDDAPTSAVIDQTMRFVNDRVITWGDIRNRSGLRQELFRRAGKVLPNSEATQIAFHRDSLEELTDEELLVQKAEQLQVAIDRDRLSNDVIAEARHRGLPLKDLALLRRIRERDAKMDAVIGWFENRGASVGPEEMEAAYRQRQSDFVRPPRARSLLIALRPTQPAERQALVSGLARLFRAAQEDADPQIKAAAADRLDRFLAANTTEQETLLVAAAGDIAIRAGAPGLGKASAALADQAVSLAARWNRVRDRDGTINRLEALRAELAGLPALMRGALFRQRAEEESQGPHASDGGELGWVEPGTYGHEIEEQALAMPIFEPSPVFWTGGAAALILVLERESGRTQSFAEVSGVLQAGLDREHRQEIRTRLTGVLRAQASIRDVRDLGEFLR